MINVNTNKMETCMSPATYDKIFDEFNKIARRFFLISAMYVILFFITTSMGFMFFGQESWPNLENIWLHVSSFVGSVIITIILISYAIAHTKFQIKQFRDIWMAWATVLIYKTTTSDEADEANKWIDENLTGLYRILKNGPRITYVFKSKEDAMAFKLVWEGR